MTFALLYIFCAIFYKLVDTFFASGAEGRPRACSGRSVVLLSSDELLDANTPTDAVARGGCCCELLEELRRSGGWNGAPTETQKIIDEKYYVFASNQTNSIGNNFHATLKMPRCFNNQNKNVTSR